MFQIYVRKMPSPVKRPDARIVSHKWGALLSIKKEQYIVAHMGNKKASCEEYTQDEPTKMELPQHLL